ncbi:MAG: PEP/pyruvate-binding domain-containing protein, partial [Verrucomicrobiota bacterium]
MSAPLVLLLADCHDASLVGGKALNLGRLTNAGFRVPEGFVVTTEAFRQSGGIELSEETRRQVVETYRKLGSPLVAVRSSATAEDMAEASMAGQYETFLNIQGENEVLDAVARCWKSLNTARTRSYLEEHGIAMDQVAMAVVVQRLVSAEVAGVLFTANPRNGSREEMVVDASYGLGESVVSGLVQPDSLVLDRTTGRVKEAVCGSKETWLRTGARESEPVDESLRGRPCLNSEQVRELWRLGLKLADHFGSAQDAEWAFDADRLYLLQSRAITTLEEIEARAECLHLTRAQLRESLAAGHGAWVRHNICETLPHPTQLTWSVVKRFMSGAGGFGGMYRMAGFEPSASASENGFLDLIAGRIYMDLSRGPEMFFEDMPFRYDIQLLRVSPDAAAGAPTIPFGSPLQQWKVASKLAGTTAKLRGLADDFDRRFEAQILPDFVGWVREEKPRDLSALTVAEWIALWSERERRVMDDFAPASLLPSLITAMALDDLKVFCAENFWDEDPEALASGLSASPKPDSTVRSAEGLHRIVHGSSTVEAWIEEFGHRAPEEFDLATPRWRERPDAVATLAGHLAGSESPLARQEQRLAEADELFQSLEKRLPNHLKPALRKHVDLSRRYLRYREDGKYFLMLGYDLLRDLAIEAGRRLGIGARVFLMDLEELRDALLTGFAPLHLLDKRGVARSAESRLILPHVVDEGDIEGLGEPPPVEGGDRMQAFSISNGVATGPAKIVFSPAEAGDLGEGYILVCPSTDPNWTPLFVKAAGLVIERGGTLSHGAVVAREMGLPAVVFDGATRAFKDGELITVDAQRGAIMRSAGLADGGTPADIEADASDEKIAPAAMPPPPGDFDRKSAGVRNFWLALWAVYFVGAFLC